MKNLLFLPILLVAFLLGLLGMQSANAQNEKIKKSKKVKIKIKTNENGNKKNFEWESDGDIPDDVKKEIEKLNLKISPPHHFNSDSNDFSFEFDDNNKDDKKKRKKIIIKNFDNQIFNQDNLKELEKNLGFQFDNFAKHFNFELRVDSLLSNIDKNIKIFKFDDNDFENLNDLKEGTTEKSEEVDLGNGKKAQITTKKTIKIIDNQIDKEKKGDLGNAVIYPNPNDGNFNLELELKNKSNAKISIFNPQGKNVYEEEIKTDNGKYNKRINIQTNGITGVYVLKVEQNGEILTRQMIIK
jgi:hypothetical protein